MSIDTPNPDDVGILRPGILRHRWDPKQALAQRCLDILADAYADDVDPIDALLGLAADLHYTTDPGPYRGTSAETFLIRAEHAIIERRGQ